MSFTVVWKPLAKRQLAELWMAAPNRATVTSAADEIDRRLRLAPMSEGESREEDVRILLLPPIGVFFRVLPSDRIVEVGQVWNIRLG